MIPYLGGPALGFGLSPMSIYESSIRHSELPITENEFVP